MIAVDTNALRRYLRGEVNVGTMEVARALRLGEAMLPPVVLTEALSDSGLTDDETRRTRSIPLMPLFRGYWFRAGKLRRELKLAGTSAATPDCLIAQACLDMDIPLITYDHDFTRFASTGLKLHLYEV